MTRITALSAALLFAATTVAAAEPVATLSQAEGNVLVNQGEEFISVKAGQALQAGDRVMLMEGASATLSFADGCTLPLAGAALLEVPAISTCAGGLAQVQALGPTLAEAGTSEEEGEKKPFMQTPAGIAVVATAVVVVAAAAGGGSGDDRPASP